MRHVSISLLIAGLLISSFMWALLFIAYAIEYEVPRPVGWGNEFVIKENPLTQDRRVADVETQTTIFWVSGNPLMLPIEVKKISPNRWTATFEKPN